MSEATAVPAEYAVVNVDNESRTANPVMYAGVVPAEVSNASAKNGTNTTTAVRHGRCCLLAGTSSISDKNWTLSTSSCCPSWNGMLITIANIVRRCCFS